MSLSIFDSSKKEALSLSLEHERAFIFFVCDVVFQEFVTIGCFILVLNLVNSWKYT